MVRLDWGSKGKGRSVGLDYGSSLAFGAHYASNSTEDDSLGSAIRSMSVVRKEKARLAGGLVFFSLYLV
jgi:hypothetical protein